MTPKQLRELVATMRELGVTECDGVKLGPAPMTAPVEKREPRPKRDPNETMFAASRMRPIEVK